MIRIGTRKSTLALWQAQRVKDGLEKLGEKCILVPIESQGDQNLESPIYAMGIQGVFTRALDTALLNNTIDIAIHSLKDVPTLLPQGIGIAAVLERGAVEDVVIYHPNFKDWEHHQIIGTGSLRRKAQWLRKYPHHQVDNLRGNVQTRLETLKKSNWGGALFAHAGLDRLGLLKDHFEVLHWMLPAPAQGAICICSLNSNKKLNELVKLIHCPKTDLCVTVEREFLRTLEGGCTAPIGAWAQVKGDKLFFKGGLFSLEGKIAIEVEDQIAVENANGFGIQVANSILNKGGKELMKKIKKGL